MISMYWIGGTGFSIANTNRVYLLVARSLLLCIVCYTLSLRYFMLDYNFSDLGSMQLVIGNN